MALGVRTVIKISNVSIQPYEESVLPSLEIAIEITLSKDEGAIVGLSGWLKDSDGCLIAPLSQLSSAQTVLELMARGSHYDKVLREEAIYKNTFIAIVGREGLEHIERKRRAHRKGDVKLILSLNVKLLKSKACISHIHKLAPDEIGISRLKILTESGRTVDAAFLVHAYDPDFTTSTTNRWILSGDSGPVFLQVVEQQLQCNITIPASDWIHDYAPKLGLGRFFVIEVPYEGIISEAWEYVRRAEEALAKCDIESVYANCREVGTLLNRIVKESIGNRPAIKKWHRAIGYFERLSSLALHREEIRNQKPVGEIKISCEDAEFVILITKALIKYAEELLQNAP